MSTSDDLGLEQHADRRVCTFRWHAEPVVGCTRGARGKRGDSPRRIVERDANRQLQVDSGGSLRHAALATLRRIGGNWQHRRQIKMRALCSSFC